MLEIMPYLLCLNQILCPKLLRQLGTIGLAMLCCRGRVTMLNLIRWSGERGSYRSIQRFYNSSLCWLQVNWELFRSYRWEAGEVYLMAGDEVTVTKAGKCTFGLGKFFPRGVRLNSFEKCERAWFFQSLVSGSELPRSLVSVNGTVTS